MPHLFTNMARKHNLLSKEPAGYRHFSWETVNSLLYLLGGMAFIAGSIFFLLSGSINYYRSYLLMHHYRGMEVN